MGRDRVIFRNREKYKVVDHCIFSRILLFNHCIDVKKGGSKNYSAIFAFFGYVTQLSVGDRRI